MGILGIIGNLFGVGRDYLQNRHKTKMLKSNQQHEIIKAETDAIVRRINSNTESDNEIDLITARNKKYTLKDEVLTYLFLMPVFIATISPFILAFDNENWTNLNVHINESYHGLNGLPSWYRYILFAIVVDVLGFRSLARKFTDKYFKNKKV